MGIRMTRSLLEQIISDAFAGVPLHVWQSPEPPDDYWTHELDANSRHVLARRCIDIVWSYVEEHNEALGD